MVCARLILTLSDKKCYHLLLFMNSIIFYRLYQKLRSVPIDCKRVLASTTSEVRMAEVNVVVIIFSAHPVIIIRFSYGLDLLRKMLQNYSRKIWLNSALLPKHNLYNLHTWYLLSNEGFGSKIKQPKIRKNSSIQNVFLQVGL